MIVTESDVAEALTRKCGLCQAVPQQPCFNICDGTPLDGSVHFYRIEPR